MYNKNEFLEILKYFILKLKRLKLLCQIAFKVSKHLLSISVVFYCKSVTISGLTSLTTCRQKFECCW